MSATLSLPRELTIYTVGEVHPSWLSWLASKSDAAEAEGPCVVEGSAVDEVDAAGVQLLIALSAVRWRATSGRMRVLNPSAPLAAACKALGVGALLEPCA